MGMFDDLLKPQRNTNQPSAPVEPKSTGLFKDFLAPQELEETAVLTQDERLGKMAVVPVSDDVYGNISFDPSAGFVGDVKRGIEGPIDVLRGEAPPERLAETAFLFSPGSAASRAASQAYRTLAPRAPTRQELREATDAGYKAIRESPVQFSIETLTKFGTDLKSKLNEKLWTEKTAAGKELHKVIDDWLLSPPPGATGASFGAYTILRERLGDIAGSPEAKIRKAAMFAMDELDKFVKAFGDEASVAGASTARGTTPLARPGQAQVSSPAAQRQIAQQYEEARANAAAGFRSDAIQGLDRATRLRTAASASGRNRDNTIRQRLTSLRLNDRAMRGFSKAEKQAIDDIIEGRPTKNAARFLGNLLGGGGGLGMGVTGGLGFGVGAYSGGGSPLLGLLGLVPPAVGYGSKTLANLLSQRQVKRLDEQIRSRSPLAQSMPNVRQYAPRAADARTRLGEREVLRPLARALMASPVQPKSLSENRPKSQLERRREEAYKRWFYGRGGGA
jgi:hypothetical protein